MIKINANQVVKKQENFWNHILFHPTDAIEDDWGRKILDEISKDKAAKMVRIYNMFEDIVSVDENGEFCYDYSLNDLRIDYLLEKGFTPMIAYGCVPPFMAVDANENSSVSHNKTRYKGKMWTTSQPKDYKLWEEICYQYTKHIVERYGEEEVSTWRIHCLNEPDVANFFMRDASVDERCTEYCKLYDGFEKGVLRATDKIKIGGPAWAFYYEFMEGFLKFLKMENKKIDYICFHNYGTDPPSIQSGERPICVENQFTNFEKMRDLVEKYFPEGIELIQDEWGMGTGGFLNIERHPYYITREHEVFSAYYGQMLTKYAKEYTNLGVQMICLSGQHEMTTEFEGFRNFFSLNFIKKPIYNAYVLGAKLKENILADEIDGEYVTSLATKDDNGDLAILINYAEKYFDENLPDIKIPVKISGIDGKKKVTVWKIDRDNTNPYRVFLKENMDEKLNEEQIAYLRDVATLKPETFVLDANGELELEVSTTANGTVLVQVEDEV